MTVDTIDYHRMAENNVNGIENGSSSNDTTMNHNNAPSMNIYSTGDVIRKMSNDSSRKGSVADRMIHRRDRGPFVSIGSKGKETVNLLDSKKHEIDGLQSCHNIHEVKVDNDISDKTILIFDLTTNGFLLSPAVARKHSNFDDAAGDENCASVNGDVYRIHLSLPSTLIKRPKFDFEKLLQTVIDDSKRAKLMSLIENCSTFLFYDGTSTISECCIPTSSLIKKFSVFLSEKLGKSHVKLYILEKMDKSDSTIQKLGDESVANADGKGSLSPSPSPSRSPSATAATTTATTTTTTTRACPPKKLNLSIKILPKTTDKMFIQSIKKDTVHYSPDSLRKYFKFHIPKEIECNDQILPRWLKPFSDKDNADSILQKSLSNFEFLENLELQRLEKGLTTETGNFNGESFKNLQDSSSYHKIYSLSNLQKEFNKQKGLAPSRENNESSSSSNPLSPVESTSNLKLCIPLPSSTGKTSNNNNNNNKTDNNHLSPHVDTDSNESLLTPMDNYEISQGIQAFTKNRYSNILPYEHSRVKLQPSPISGPSITPHINESLPIGNFKHSITNKNTSPKITVSPPKQNNNNDNDTNNINNNNNNGNRKRRGSSISYFNQNKDASISNDDTDRENFNDYFNANYLKIPQVNPDLNYIATQAPLPSTVDDFWKVVSTNKVKVIISLNSTDELYMRKWDIYWNNNRSSRKYNVDIVETFENACNIEGCILRVFKFYKNKGGTVDESTKKTVFQLQYTKWLDSCGIVMEEIVSLCRIKNMLLHNPSVLLTDLRNGNCQNTEKYSNQTWNKELLHSKESDPLISFRSSPVLVHCSAGCGRTGVFITLDFILNVLTEPINSSNSIDVWNMDNDLIFIVVNELRKQRISMVQNLTQYITCYESLLNYFALEKAK